MKKVINWFKSLQPAKIIIVFLAATFMLSIQACDGTNVAKKTPKNAEMSKVVNNYSESKTFGEKLQDWGKDMGSSAEQLKEDVTKGTKKSIENLQQNIEGASKDLKKTVERGTEDIGKNIQRQAEDTGEVINKTLKKAD
jgi:gas vesicle protein